MLPLSARHLTMGNDHAGRSVPSKYAQRPDESCGGAERGAGQVHKSTSALPRQRTNVS